MATAPSEPPTLAVGQQSMPSLLSPGRLISSTSKGMTALTDGGCLIKAARAGSGDLETWGGVLLMVTKV